MRFEMNRDDMWTVFWVTFGVAFVVFILVMTSYYSKKDYRHELACRAAGGVPLTVSSHSACAHIDGFIALALKP